MHKLKKSVNDFLIKFSIQPYKIIRLNTKVQVNHYKNGVLKVKNL